jgi:hypothetical protein
MTTRINPLRNNYISTTLNSATPFLPLAVAWEKPQHSISAQK